MICFEFRSTNAFSAVPCFADRIVRGSPLILRISLTLHPLKAQHAASIPIPSILLSLSSTSPVPSILKFYSSSNNSKSQVSNCCPPLEKPISQQIVTILRLKASPFFSSKQIKSRNHFLKAAVLNRAFQYAPNRSVFGSWGHSFPR